jgi:hypothetical protein
MAMSCLLLPSKYLIPICSHRVFLTTNTAAKDSGIIAKILKVHICTSFANVTSQLTH